MAKKKIVISTGTAGGEPVIQVYPFLVRQDKAKHIRFENELRDTSDPKKGTDVTIQFYEIVSGVVDDTPVSGFCKDVGTKLEIDATKKFNCKVEIPGEFKFDVVANGYKTYDPVIIVEVPPAGFPWLLGLLLSALFGGIGLFAGLKFSKARARRTAADA